MQDDCIVGEIKDLNKDAFKKALCLASHCMWGITGAMTLLIMLNERLYLENEMYPYAAKIGAVICLLFACLFDSCYNYLVKENVA